MIKQKYVAGTCNLHVYSLKFTEQRPVTDDNKRDASIKIW